MISEEQLKNNIYKYLQNIMELWNSFQLYKMIKTDIDGSINKTNRYSYMFVTIVISLQKTFVVDSYKLFYNESKSIPKMIGMCENNIKYFKDKDIKFNIKELRTLLDENKDEIENLKGMRDKFFAHCDSIYFNDPSKLFSDLPVIIDKLGKLIEGSYKNVKEIYFMLQPGCVNDNVDEIKKELLQDILVKFKILIW